MRISSAFRAAGIALLVAVVASPVNAQDDSRLIDAYSLGIGLSMYAGDLDGVGGRSLVAYMGSSNLAVYAGVESDVGPVAVMLEAHYLKLNGTNEIVDGSHHIAGLDILAARQLGFAGGAFRIFAGVSPSMVAPSYRRRTQQAIDDGWAVEGGHFALLMPVGIVIQDRVRMGVRFSSSDLLDGRDNGNNKDMVGFLSVGYRIGR